MLTFDFRLVKEYVGRQKPGTTPEDILASIEKDWEDKFNFPARRMVRSVLYSFI